MGAARGLQGQVGVINQSKAQVVNGSLRFDGGSSQYLNRTPSSGNKKTFTFSFWLKRTRIGDTYDTVLHAPSGSAYSVFAFYQDSLYLQQWNGSGTDWVLVSSAVYRDPSAWYNFVFAFDTTQGTSTNRVKIYVNGQQITTFSSVTYPNQDADTYFNLNVAHYLGQWFTNGHYLDAYMSNVYLIDGQQLDASYFGFTDPLTNTWRPKKYKNTTSLPGDSGSAVGFGTNGFYLPFDTDGTGTIGIGTDRSGRGNHWTTNNFVTTAAGIQTNPNIMPDSPSGISFSTAPTAGIGTTTGMTKPSNYCTWNPLDVVSQTLSNGNLNSTGNTDAANSVGTLAASSGKWYWEITAGSNQDVVGISSIAVKLSSYPGSNSTSWGYYGSNGSKYNSGSGSSYGDTFASGDVIGVALDLNEGTLKFYKNNTVQNSGTAAATGLTGLWTPALRTGNASGSVTSYANFGQKPFKYAPPSGFLPLCTANLPRPTIVRPDQYVGVSTWSGDNTTRSFNIGWKPDFVWIKCRSTFAGHRIFDSVRGVKKSLIPDGAYTEDADSVFGYVSSYNRDGFTLTPGTYSGYESGDVNMSGRTYVGWAWKAGGSGGGYSFWKDDIGYSTASAAGLTAGTITPTGASVNTKSGFSIITYTGSNSNSTISHGLGKVPDFAIIKNLDGAFNWKVYHKSLGNTKALTLNDTSTEETYNYWQNTTPTSTLFYLSGGIANVCRASERFVAYLWAEIPGFSKFGSYSGTGVAGNFVQTGFRPKWIMIKNYSGGSISNWGLVDSTRSYANVANHTLAANLNQGESYYAGGESVFGAGNKIDLVSNGFVLREGNAWANETSTSYIYIAFAESPSFNLYGGQSNAR